MRKKDRSNKGFGEYEVFLILKNRFEPNNDDYNPIYCPIYCEEHLEAYVLDFANRVKLYTQKKDA